MADRVSGILVERPNEVKSGCHSCQQDCTYLGREESATVALEHLARQDVQLTEFGVGVGAV